MNAYIFPGQGAQFVGMGLDLYEKSDLAKELFEQANEILGFKITDIMFEGTTEDLKQTKVTQPAVFLHSVILSKVIGNTFNPDMVAGHSLGELSALVANKTLSFEDGLKLVSRRALAMQKACELKPSTMAAVLGLDDTIVEQVCKEIEGVVVPANYNCPGQLVISGEVEAINAACEALKEKGFEVSQEKLPLNLKGPDNEELTIDLAVVGSLNSENLLLYSSGIHGVEGFAGSAIQLSVLDRLKDQALFSDYCVVFIHIINPYGMAWHRRVNENNVDLYVRRSFSNHLWNWLKELKKVILKTLNI